MIGWEMAILRADWDATIAQVKLECCEACETLMAALDECFPQFDLLMALEWCSRSSGWWMTLRRSSLRS